MARLIAGEWREDWPDAGDLIAREPEVDTDPPDEPPADW